MTDRIQELEAVIREAVHALNVARWPDVVAYDSAGVAAVHAALTAVDAARVLAVKEARTDEDGVEVEVTADRAAVNLERDGAWVFLVWSGGDQWYVDHAQALGAISTVHGTAADVVPAAILALGLNLTPERILRVRAAMRAAVAGRVDADLAMGGGS